MSKRPRRNHAPAFKAKVALDALKGSQTIVEHSERYQVHPNQITDWKKQLLEHVVEVFFNVIFWGGYMHRFFTLLVLAVFIFITFSSYTFAESNLSGSSDGQRVTVTQLSRGKSSEKDRAFWDLVKDSKNLDELKAYLEQFPKGVFAPLAQARLKSILDRGVQPQSGAITSSPQVALVKNIGRDGRFIAYDNNAVMDTSTNLMWADKDNGSDVNWADAKSYCENYRGGGYSDWRMPTQDELAGLYDAGKTNQTECRGPLGGTWDVHLTELIHLTCTWVWGSETRGSEAFYSYFSYGYRPWKYQGGGSDGRALPVRSGK